MKNVKVLAVVVCMMAAANFASAEIIRGINIDFVTIGNANNSADTTGYGAVGYNYRIGKYEVTNAQWGAFTAAVGAPTGNPPEAYNTDAQFTGAQQPTNNVSWYEAAQFCNYLTSGNKSLGAYLLGTNGSITVDRASAISAYGTVYVIPTEDEWQKAAYFKPEGYGYSLYANGLNTIPAADNGWNYYGGSYGTPWNVGTGTQEQNGTFDMMGNVFEWNETLESGSSRILRGGSFGDFSGIGGHLSSSGWSSCYPFGVSGIIGFRVASVPEPCSFILLSLGGLMLRGKIKDILFKTT
ncbi:MAG: formylglycine-generating enzyme family protein [Sedimentisphaerales bacterium]